MGILGFLGSTRLCQASRSVSGGNGGGDGGLWRRGSPQLRTKESSEGDCDSGQVFSVSMS